MINEEEQIQLRRFDSEIDLGTVSNKTTNKTKPVKKIEKKIQQDQQKNCLVVEPELFDVMKTSSGKIQNSILIIPKKGVTISELNQKGFKVLLFFASHVGCINCKGTMYDIHLIQEDLLKMNCIPVIVHEESYEVYDEFLNSSEETKIFSNILHMERKSFVNRFKIEESSLLTHAINFFKKGYTESIRSAKLGYKNELTYLPKGLIFFFDFFLFTKRTIGDNIGSCFCCSRQKNHIRIQKTI